MRKMIGLIMSLCLAAGLVGCGSQTENQVNISTDMKDMIKSEETDTEVEKMNENSEEKVTETEIILDFNGIQVSGTLDNSKTSQDFLSLLPMTLSMTRFYDREYAVGLGDNKLSLEGKVIDDYENGDITYYIAGNALAIFFDQEGNSHQSGLIRMGKVTSDLNTLIRMLGDQQVTVFVKEDAIKESDYDFNQFENVQISGIDIADLNQEQQEILYQYARYSEAMTNADMNVLDEMITDDSTFTHMSGRTQTKQEYMADIENGSLDYITIEIQNPKVTIDGDRASLTCTTVLTANAYGARGSWPFSGSRVLEKHDGQWKIVNR